MKCLKVARNSTQKIPPYSAYQCPGKTRKGKDGLYRSSESANGVWRWVKIEARGRGTTRHTKS
jgi:hypothetical protein